MSLELTHLKKTLDKIEVEADWLSIRKIDNTVTRRVARNQRMDDFNKYYSQGLMVEVMLNGQIAYGATDSDDFDGIKNIAEKASQLAKRASKYSLFKFDGRQRPSAQGEFNSTYKQDVDSLSEAEIFDVLMDVSGQLKVGSAIKETAAAAMEIDRRVQFVSSSGSCFEQRFLMHDLNISATATDGVDNQIRSGGNGTAQVGLEVYDRSLWTDEAKRVGQEAVELLEAQECPAETCDLLLHPDQLYLQIHESIGHPLELDRILGDERNYAGWSFVQKEDFGKLQYGSPLLNVTFDPTVEGEMASYLFDDTGDRAKREYLIKEGKLLRGIGGLESQARSQIAGVASSRTEFWNRPPIDRMANINIEPGESSFDEMISSIQRGVYMMRNKSWSIDDYRNKFQFGCEYGRLIENGEITKVVKNPNYRGVSNPFWNNLSMVGDRETFKVYGSPYCGKGEPNQVIRVGHATPTCLFKNIEIFGGAE